MSKFIGILVIFWACCSAAAATLQQLTLDQMTQSATAIVRARVTSFSASFTGSTIYTHYKLQTTDTYKGSGAAEVMLPGGVAKGVRQSYPGVPALKSGTEYVLFLWTSSSTGITHLVGLTQGLFNVGQLSNGTLQVSRPDIGENMFDAAGRAAKAPAIQMALTDLKTRIGTTVKAGASQ